MGNRCLYSTLSAKCSQKCDYPGLSCISEIRNVIFSILIRLLKVIEYKDKQTQVTRFMNTERVPSSLSGVWRGKSANIQIQIAQVKFLAKVEQGVHLANNNLINFQLKLHQSVTETGSSDNPSIRAAFYNSPPNI